MDQISSNQLQDLRREMCEISRRLFARRLASGTSGNISARLHTYQESFLIKPSGKSLEDVASKEFLLVSFSGEVLEGQGVPSMEMAFHRSIYSVRPDIQAVVHGHSAYATAYVIAKGRLPVVTVEARIGLGSIGIIDYAHPGSEELATKVTEVFREETMQAVVLCDHGFITVGESLKAAYYLADVLEENAKVAYLQHALSHGEGGLLQLT